jgi:ADP-heptose:LPS heptosyltransferase
MNIWNRIEQYFKERGLGTLERLIGLPKLSPADIDMSSIKRILVVRQHDQLGDFLLSSPVFRALRENFPMAFIAVVARSYTAEVAQNNRYLDDVIPFYEVGYYWNPRSVWQFIKKIRSDYDLAIVLNTVSHSLSTDLIAFFSRARIILGPSHKRFPGTVRNFFYHLEAPCEFDARHQTERNLDILRYIGVDTDDRTENIHLTDEELNWANDFLKSQGVNMENGVVFVHPGAGKVENRWPAANFALIANHLSDAFGLDIMVSWGPKETEVGEEVIRLLNQLPVSVPGLGLRKLASLIAVSKLCFCNDTGVMHVAAGVGTPLVAVFGPTNPALWKPIGEKFIAIRGNDHTCASVGVKDVLMAAERILTENN